MYGQLISVCILRFHSYQITADYTVLLLGTLYVLTSTKQEIIQLHDVAFPPYTIAHTNHGRILLGTTANFRASHILVTVHYFDAIVVHLSQTSASLIYRKETIILQTCQPLQFSCSQQNLACQSGGLV